MKDNHKRQLYMQYRPYMDAYPAAKKAGYSDSSAKKAAQRLDPLPEVQAGIEKVRQASRLSAAFTLDKAMEQAEEDRRFARENKNSMAAHKSTELQSRLAGFLVEKVEMVSVDLTTALEQARTRVFVMPRPASPMKPVEQVGSTEPEPSPANGGESSAP